MKRNLLQLLILSFIHITYVISYYYFNYSCIFDKHAMNEVLFYHITCIDIRRLITGATFISQWNPRFTRQCNLAVVLIVNCVGTARLLSRENRNSLQVKVYIVARWYIKYSSVFRCRRNAVFYKLCDTVYWMFTNSTKASVTLRDALLLGWCRGDAAPTRAMNSYRNRPSTRLPRRHQRESVTMIRLFGHAILNWSETPPTDS